MLLFFHFANKYEFEITSYHLGAEGKVEKTKSGLRFVIIKVKAKVRLGTVVSNRKIDKIANLTDKDCLISGSLACPVKYNVEVVK